MGERISQIPGHTKPSEAELSAHGEIKAGIRARQFAQPAIRAVLGSADQAKFFDDFLWIYIGDPLRAGHAMPKKPGWGDYLYDYDMPEVKGYTQAGVLIDVRSTRDPAASKLERYLVVVGDMEDLTVVRHRVNAIELTPATHLAGAAIKLVVTTDRFDVLDGDPPDTEDLMALNDDVQAQSARHERQACIQLSGTGTSYKPFGGSEQMVLGVDRAVRDRHTLAELAVAAGLRRSDDSAVEIPPSYLSHRRAA